MGATIVFSGERIVNDDTMTVFAHGAYNLGSITETRTLSTTAAHPGEHVDHVQTAGGEDSYIIGPDKTPYSYGILEIDFGLIADCSVDYTHTTHEVPAIPYHMNFGAYLRNIVCVDPVTSDVSPDEPLSTDSGTAGAFQAYHTETVFVDSDNADGEAMAADVVVGDKESAVKNRSFLKQAYFLTDPSAAYDTIAYIAG